MKARTIRRLRKQILASGYARRRLEYWRKGQERLEKWYRVALMGGYGAAVIPYVKGYYKDTMPGIYARVKWYERRTDEQLMAKTIDLAAIRRKQEAERIAREFPNE